MHRQLALQAPITVQPAPCPTDSAWDSDEELYPSSPTSSDSSFDEDEVNRHMTPCWSKYRNLLKSRGFKLDTVRDVREYYKHLDSDSTNMKSSIPIVVLGQDVDDDTLCPDAGLRDNLFRGTRIRDGRKIMVKGVHLYSREYEVIRLLSLPPLRNDSMNHTIPVLDMVEVNNDQIAFIVMEEWSPQLIPDNGPCCLSLFLAALRQCIEHAVFLHKHRIAHLDISLRNLLTNYEGQYAYIDYELSQRFDGTCNPRMYGHRGTELPPECERGEHSDPYKIDVWAIAILILRACKLTGYNVPELMLLVKPMLHDRPDHRPSMLSVLHAFDDMMARKHFIATCPISH